MNVCFTTYNNINTNFTFENIYSHVNKFWSNEVTIKKEQYWGIWLTIIVSTKNNISFKLINALPFNTSDNTDVLNILKQRLDNNYLDNSKDILDSITFKYSFYKKNYNYKESDSIDIKTSIFNYFNTRLKSYFVTEVKVKKDFTPNYPTTSWKKHILNPNTNNSNTLNIKKLKQESDILSGNKYIRKNNSYKRKY